MIYVTRKEHFNAAHKVWRAEWSEEKNLEVFGKCSNKNWHGHNYDLLFKVTGDVNPETGFVMDLKELSDLLNKEISDRFDHRNLNLDVAEFKNLNPTAENIAKVVFDIMRPKIDARFTIQVTLYETPRNFVVYPD